MKGGKFWPSLSKTLTPVTDLATCQSCGRTAAEDPDLLLARWQEHDDKDRPTSVVVLLCRRCSDSIIEPHPRLYGRIHNWAPLPGSMPCCDSCTFRDGVSCTNPLLKSNGGPGLPLRVPQAGVIFVDGMKGGRKFSERIVDYKSQPACDGRNEAQ